MKLVCTLSMIIALSLSSAFTVHADTPPAPPEKKPPPEKKAPADTTKSDAKAPADAKVPAKAPAPATKTDAKAPAKAEVVDEQRKLLHLEWHRRHRHGHHHKGHRHHHKDKKAAAAPVDKQGDPAPAAKEEFTPAEVKKVEAFFEELSNAVVKNQDACPKMAADINALLDKNEAWLKKLPASGRVMPEENPKKDEDELEAGALGKCLHVHAVEVAVKRFIAVMP